MPTFEPFPSIYRLSRDCVVTEKLDGTNAQVIVEEDGSVHAASRTRLITPQDDNAGFAKWVEANTEELRRLGPGRHFGEWWGQGIQRNYGLKEKRFSLFNTARWGLSRPECCHVVPVLWSGVLDTTKIDAVLEELRVRGSVAVPGFMKPEGIVVFHVPSQHLFKKTLDHNDGHKGANKS